MDRQKQLSDKRARLANCMAELTAIRSTTEKEKRVRNQEEATKWDSLTLEADQLTLEIRTLESQVQEDFNRAKAAGEVRAINWEATGPDSVYEYRNSDGKVKGAAFTIWNKSKPKNTVSDWVGRNYSVGESEHFTPGQIVTAFMRGPRNESEKRALSEGTSSAGGYTVPILTSAQLIDNVRAKSRLFAAGATTYILDSQQQSMAKITADATAAWVAENGAITASDPTFGTVAFASKSLKATIKGSLELFQDSINIDQAIDATITGAFATALDLAGINGAGSSTEPKGILNYTSPSSYAMGTNGAAITNYDPLCELFKAMNDNHCDYATHMITSPKVLNTLMKLKDTTNQPLVPPWNIRDIQFWETASVPTNLTKGTSTTVCSALIFGGFQNVYFGSRLQTTIYPTTESLASNGQFSFVGVMRGDWQPRREADFGVIKDIL